MNLSIYLSHNGIASPSPVGRVSFFAPALWSSRRLSVCSTTPRNYYFLSPLTVGKILIYGFSLPYALLSFFLSLPYFTFSSLWLKCWKSSLKIHSTSLNHYTILPWFPLASLWSSQDSATEREIQDWPEQDYYTGTWNHSLFYTYT